MARPDAEIPAAEPTRAVLAEPNPVRENRSVPFYGNEIREVGGRYYVASSPRRVLATAYDACVLCTGKTDGITFTGIRAQPYHTLAVDPNVIPLGSLVVIDGFPGVFRAEDTGGKIKGDRIDIFLSSHAEALIFGQQTRMIHILTPIS